VDSASSIIVRIVRGLGEVNDLSATLELAIEDGPVDVAVLRIPPGSVPIQVAAFGRIAAPVRCEALGFPLFKLRQGRDAGSQEPFEYRDSHHAEGRASPFSNGREGTLELTVDAPTHDPNTEESPWAGMSGAGVFSDGYLIALVSRQYQREGLNRLTASPMAVWYAALPPKQLAELVALIGLPDKATDLAVVGPGQLLGDYLTAAAAAASTHPYPTILPQGRVPPTLTSVYLRQDLRTEEGDPVGEQVVAADVVRRGLDDAIVVAEPGGGKSSLLRTWTTDLIAQYNRLGFVQQFPVLVEASRLLRNPDEPRPFAAALAAEATLELQSFGLNQTLDWEFFAKPPLPGTHWLVLIDALDEVTAADTRRRLMGMLAAQDRRKYRIIVATRPTPEQDLTGLGEHTPRYTIEPFNPDDVDTMARSWFSVLQAGHDVDAACTDFRIRLERADLARLARLPLMAAMLCQIHSTYPEESLPHGRTAVFAKFVDLLTERYNTAGPGGLRAQITTELDRYADRTVLEYTLRFLSQLPAHLCWLAAARQSGDLRAAETVLYERADPPIGLDGQRLRDLIGSILRRTGLFTIRAREYTFAHQTLQEYLAARHALTSNTVTMNLERSLDLARAVQYGPRGWLEPSPQRTSYIAFLVNLAPDEADISLAQLARQGGIRGCTYIAKIAAFGDPLPDVTLKLAATQLRGAAIDLQTINERNAAARSLAQFHDIRIADLMFDLIRHYSVEPRMQIAMAGELAKIGDPRGNEALHKLARDQTLGRSLMLMATTILAEIRDPDSTDMWYARAKDSRLGEDRAEAIEELARLGDPRVNNLWYALARDRDLNSAERISAAEELTRRADPRSPDLLFELAEQQQSRIRTAEMLGRLGDPRGFQLLNTDAHNDCLPMGTRILAAEAAARLGDARALPLLRSWVRERTLADESRILAIEALVRRADGQIAQCWRELAQDLDVGREVRARAVRALQRLGDTCNFWRTLAHSSHTDDLAKVTAAEELARLGDTEGATLLRTLASDPAVSAAASAEAARCLLWLAVQEASDTPPPA